MATNGPPVDYRVQRRAYTQDEFDEVYKCEMASESLLDTAKEYVHHLRERRVSDIVRNWIPILRWAFAYKPLFLINDVIAGVTVAILSVPQAMAYATLAGMPPVIGLYTSFYAPLLYAFFGTSKHVSLGMFAVVALMVGTTCEHYTHTGNSTANVTGANEVGNLPSVEAAATVTFIIGVVLAIMSLLQLHFVASYMSDHLVGGFTTGAVCHVFASQLPKLFGIKIPSHNGLFKLFYILKDFFLALHTTNLPDLITSAICIAFLHIGKWYVNPRVRKRSPAPIPFELIAVIVATVASYFANFHKRYKMAIVLNIPRGFPAPKPPNMNLVPELLANSIVTAVVVFAITISVAKLFGKRHSYAINQCQELRALGLVELVISLFSCHPASGSLTRAAINSECQAHSQVTSFVSSALILFVILWAGPLLEPLPMCILASIIVIALQSMFLQLGDTRKLWRMSKIDLAIWVVSFVATAVWDVSEGLGIAIGFALITVIFRSQWPKSVKLVQVGDTELYRDAQNYLVHSTTPSVLIFRFDAPLLFLNCDKFKEKALALVDTHERELAEVPAEIAISTLSGNNDKAKVQPSPYAARVKFLVIDASGLIHIDQMGVNAFKELAVELRTRRIDTYVASCKAQVRELCSRCGLYASLPKRHFFPSIHDAVLCALQKDDISSSTSSVGDESV